jgi:hypothetical protein
VSVDAERVRDHVQQLPTVPDAVCPTQPERVVEVSVDALCVVAAPVQHFEVLVTRWDLANVLGGTVVLVERGARHTGVASAFRSDRCGQFVERCRDTQTMVAGFEAQFVVAASQVLDERVAPDHVARGLIGSQTAHRPEPRLESSVVALDAVVGVTGGVVEHFGEKVIDDAQQRCSKISRHLSWPVAARQHCLEEPGRRFDIASLRHQKRQ